MVKGLIRSLVGQKSPAVEEPVEGPMTRSLSEGLNEGDAVMLEQDSQGNDEIVLESPHIAQALLEGVPLLRITRKKRVQRIFRIDLDRALVAWSNKAMALDRIQQIRVGEDARNYREEYGVSKDYNDRWATILYNDLATGKLKALHIIAPSRKDFELFILTLERLVARRRQLMKYLAIPDENFAHIHWKNYIAKDSNKRQFLSFDDVLKLTKRLHINCDEEYLRQLFYKSDTTGKGALNFEEFQKFVKRLKERPELMEIFNSIAQDNHISFRGFKDFVMNVQLQDDSPETLKKIYLRFTQKTNGKMTFDGFSDYLNSSYVPATISTPEDLTRPLNEYFISSSHNTYLLGRQYGHSTSIEGYTRALQRGCRSIEIDIWDGDQGPVVTHGKITSSITLRDVLETARKYAFIVTPLPLFLSLEVHCKPAYQVKVRDLLLQTFGDMLITSPIFPDKNSLPSPVELKHKVLVKVKRTAFENKDGSQSSFTSSSTAQEDEDEEPFNPIKPRKKKQSFQIIPELSSLGVYAQGLKFTNFSLPESKQPNHIFSFSDRTFMNMIKNAEKRYLVKKHNRKFLFRVYPAGYRYNSSNFIPIKPWLYGTQMVATNWQTFDLGQQVNEAMFNCGSKCGYKLKPRELRNVNPSQKFKFLETEVSFVKFSIDIISAQLLPRPKDLKPEDPLDPYVMFELIESTLLTPMKITELGTSRVSYYDSGTFTTRPIVSNGFNPSWNCRIEGTLKDQHRLNFIRFMIKTGDIPIAVHCFKLDNLQQGYRHIPLYDLQGEEYIFSTLFVKVNYEVLTK
jgi:phosphatidylinositol phospholipase C delta